MAANWLELEDHDTGSKYFYNQITHRSQFDAPIQPQRVPYLQNLCLGVVFQR